MTATLTDKALLLDRRVSEALAEPLTSSEVKALLSEVREEVKAAEARADRLDEQALSPHVSMAEATAKRKLAGETRFLADRLDASIPALHRHCLAREDAELKQRQAEAIAERDALVADIRDQYPDAVATITALVRRIHASDLRLAALGVAQSAEGIARGIQCRTDGNFMGGRLVSAPLLVPNSTAFAWSFGLGGLTFAGEFADD